MQDIIDRLAKALSYLEVQGCVAPIAAYMEKQEYATIKEAKNHYKTAQCEFNRLIGEGYSKQQIKVAFYALTD